MIEKKTFNYSKKLLIGWNEWCALPGLNIPAIKAKIDTGAKTSAIHAFNIQFYCQGKKPMVAFDLHPIQANDQLVVSCHAEVIDCRSVMSSNGQKEDRYVILTPIELGKERWKIQLTLSNRDLLKFRLLLGREALAKKVVIDPQKRMLLGKLEKKQWLKKYIDN